MDDDVATLQSVIRDVRPSGWQSSEYPALHLVSEKWRQQLSKYYTVRAAGKGWRPPLEPDLQALIDKLVPPPPTGALSPEVVARRLELSLGGSGASVVADLTELDRLSWSGMWDVLARLAKRGPGLDGQTYLELLEGQLRALPNVNQRLVAAAIAALLMRGGRTLGVNQLPVLLRLSNAMLACGDRDQMEILGQLGMDPDAAEGTIAVMESQMAELAAQPVSGLAAAGVAPDDSWMSVLDQVWKGINRNANTFLDWAKPKKMPFGAYIGIAAHSAIAANYEWIHSSEGEQVMTNSWSVASILAHLEVLYEFRGSAVRVALALARPDIFELGLVHGMPPGWVYEIKPATSAALAEYEVLFYADALGLTGIPVVPGPPGAPGTSGVVAVPSGWVAYMSPLPGVIVYRYRQATRAALAARKQASATSSEVDDQVAKRVAEVGIVVSSAGLLASIIEALLPWGWVLLL